MSMRGRMMRQALCLAAGLLAGVAASAADAGIVEGAPVALAQSGFALRLPKNDAVAYRGLVNYDKAGGPASAFLYPVGGAGIVGLLAGIATHGALVESGKNSEKTRLQTEADKVLDPFRPTLDGLTHRSLMAQGLQRLGMPATVHVIDANESSEGWIVESLPVFSMTQDRGALILENAVLVYAASDPTNPRYRNVVKVVSNLHDDADLESHWAADEGKRLKDESERLFGHSIRLLMQALEPRPAEPALVEKTFRYTEGKEQRMERAQLVRESCGRAVIKTLRGWLMSVPLRQSAPPAPSPDCASDVAYPA
jgi:hypothetical protein